MSITNAIIGEQPLDERQKALLNEVYERLTVFEQDCRPYHEEARTTRAILRLQDPFQDPPNAKEPTLQLQTLLSTFNNCVADQMQNMPEPRILPERPELAEISEDLQDTVRHIVYTANDYEAIHRVRAEDLYGQGTSIIQTVWDPDMCYGKGDIAIIRWPIEAFLWDTKAENIQDARALIKVSWHPISWYKAHYPKESAYVNAEDNSYNSVGMPDSQKGVATDEGRAMLLEYWYRRYDWDTKKYTINVAYCAGGALLDEEKNVFMHGLYPFTVDVHTRIEGSPVGKGMIGEFVPMMRYINRYARYIDTNLRMSSKVRIIARKGANIDLNSLSDWECDIIEAEGIREGEDYAWLQSKPLSNSVVGQMLQFQNDLKQDSGANQFTRGETTSGIVSGKAIASLQEAGGKVAGLRTDTLNNGFKKIVEQILWLISEFYDKERILLITGRDGRAKTVQASAAKFFGNKGKEFQPPPYMVQVEVNKRNPVRVEAQNEMFMSAYTMAAQAQQHFPLSALFQLMNIDGKDRLLPIIRDNERHQEMLQEMQTQIQQMAEQNELLEKEKQNLMLSMNELTDAMMTEQEQPPQGIQPQDKTL